MITVGTALPASHAGHTEGRHPDFRHLLGETAWDRLPAAVRLRFTADHRTAGTLARARVYAGAMDVRCSRAGRWLAQASRWLRMPIAPHTGGSVPVVVMVYAATDGGATWERRYLFEQGACIVRSTKRLDRDGALTEYLGAGLHMRLAVSERAGELHFESRGYFMALGALRIELPRWLSPGRCHVVHSELGGGRFRFSMQVYHHQLGELFFQQGEFRDPGEESC